MSDRRVVGLKDCSPSSNAVIARQSAFYARFYDVVYVLRFVTFCSLKFWRYHPCVCRGCSWSWTICRTLSSAIMEGRLISISILGQGSRCRPVHLSRKVGPSAIP